MISRLKTKIIILLAVAALLLGGLAILNHHPMVMTKTDSHADCNATCKVACFSQAITNLVAIPTHPDALLFALPLIALALFTYVLAAGFSKQQNTYLYSLGPPLYKRLETYRY